jgi:hypothetical protein
VVLRLNARRFYAPSWSATNSNSTWNQSGIPASAKHAPRARDPIPGDPHFEHQCYLSHHWLRSSNYCVEFGSEKWAKVHTLIYLDRVWSRYVAGVTPKASLKAAIKALTLP